MFDFVKFENFPKAYESIVEEVYHNGHHVDGNGTHEKIHAGFTVLNPKDSEMLQTIRHPSVRYAVSELIWYWAGSNSLDWISHFSTFWKHLSDDGKTSNSAYGFIIDSKFGFNQIDMVVKELKKDMYSRRATIKINTPRMKSVGDIYDLSDTKDEFCTLSLQFLIRDNKLHMIVNMRSNDLFVGLPYDAIYFVSIMDEILEKLKPTYSDLQKGSYTHFAGSIHIYDRDYDKFTNMLAEKDNATSEIDIDGIRHDAKSLYEKIEESFYEDGQDLSFKDYKQTHRFEDIVSPYIIKK